MPAISQHSKNVLAKTADQATAHIDQNLHRTLHYFAERPQGIDGRLQALEQEWDLERLLETNMASLTLLGTLAGLMGSRPALVFAGVVSAFMIQHASRGWCPPASLMRRMGVRTMDEILTEHYALRMLRGDFDDALRGDYERNVDRLPVLMAALGIEAGAA